MIIVAHDTTVPRQQYSTHSYCIDIVVQSFYLVYEYCCAEPQVRHVPTDVYCQKNTDNCPRTCWRSACQMNGRGAPKKHKSVRETEEPSPHVQPSPAMAATQAHSREHIGYSQYRVMFALSVKHMHVAAATTAAALLYHTINSMKFWYARTGTSTYCLYSYIPVVSQEP